MIFHYLTGFIFIIIILCFSDRNPFAHNLPLTFSILLIIIFLGLFLGIIYQPQKKKSWLFVAFLSILFLFRFYYFKSNTPNLIDYYSSIDIKSEIIEKENEKIKAQRTNSKNKSKKFIPFKNPYHTLEGTIISINGFKKERFQILVRLDKIEKIKKNSKSNQKETDLSTNSNLPLNLLVHTYLKPTHLAVGDKIRFRPNFMVETSKMEESGYRNYLIGNQIFAAVYQNKEPLYLLTRPIPNSIRTDVVAFLNQSLNQIWTSMKTKADKNISMPASALVYSLLTGNKDSLPDKLKDDFRKTGTYHVLAVSGMHAMFLTIFFFYFFRLLGLRRKVAMFPIIFLILPGYLFLTHFQISIVRTFIMGMFGFLLSLANRKLNLIAILITTFVLTLFYQPDLAYKVSLQLSFSAVLGIGLMLEYIQVAKIRRPFIQGILVSIGAQLGTLAFIIYYFGYVNFFTVFYNLFVSILIGIFYILSLLFYLIPFEFYAAHVGKLLSLLGDLIAGLLSFTRFDLNSFYLNEGKNQLLIAFLIFSIFFISIQGLIYFKKNKPAN